MRQFRESCAVREEVFRYAVALTGGIATGKSTVSKILGAQGYTVIDADTIAHQVLDEAAAEVAALFGDEIVRAHGVDRKALGTMVFADVQKRKALEALLHPRIYSRIVQNAEEEEVKKRPYFIDIPLFFETGRYNIAKVVVVYAGREAQTARIVSRDGLSKEEALRRIEAQLDIEEKRQRADYLVDNSGDRAALHRETARVMSEIERDFL